MPADFLRLNLEFQVNTACFTQSVKCEKNRITSLVTAFALGGSQLVATVPPPAPLTLTGAASCAPPVNGGTSYAGVPLGAGAGGAGVPRLEAEGEGGGIGFEAEVIALGILKLRVGVHATHFLAAL